MIPVISQNSFASVTFLVDFALKNEACMLDSGFSSNWQAVKKWVKDDSCPDFDYLVENYGDAQVPVLVGNTSSNYETMTLSEFVDKFLIDRLEVAYLKDWHFQSQFPDADLYSLPAFLSSDWINKEEWTMRKENPAQGDYRFVYIGAKGSWTRFHSDVMGSFSWSANVCGRKLWYMIRPGMECHFQQGSHFVEDIRSRPELWKAAGVMEFIQQAGQIIFVPSGWYHQVHNLEDSISINHNVINAYNVDILLKLLEERLVDVRKELSDVLELGVYSAQEFDEQCQSLLLADFRMNLPKLMDLMNLVIASRSHLLSTAVCHPSTVWFCSAHTEKIFECKKNPQCLQNLRNYLISQCFCNNSDSFCDNCVRYVSSYELLCASAVKDVLIKFVS